VRALADIGRRFVPWMTLCVMAASLRARAEDKPPISLTILAAGDLDGRLADPDCRARAPQGRGLAHLAASLSHARAEAESAGRIVLPPVFLGDFTGPAALGRFVMNQGGGAAAMASLAGRSGFRTLILGNHWLDRTPAEQIALAGALKTAGIQPLNANVTCRDRPDCDTLAALPAFTVLKGGGVSVAVVGAAGEDLAALIDPALLRGLTLAPAGAALATRAAEARSAGAGLVVGAVHTSGGPTGFSALAALQQAAAGVDLLLVNRLGEMAESGAVVLPASGPALVSIGAPPGTVVRVDFDLVAEGATFRAGGWHVEPVFSAEPDAALSGALGDLVVRYCDAWDRPLDVRAGGPVGVAEFLRMLLDELRRAARADVAFANLSIADPRVFPLEGRLSGADIHSALPWDDPVVRVSTTGAKLRSMRGRELARTGGPRVAFAGIGEKDGVVLVNDRPLDDAGRYSVAMPEFLSRGGDGMVTESLSVSPVLVAGGVGATVRGVMMSRLAGRQGDLREVFPALDLAGRIRWSWTGSTTLSAADTRLDNRTKDSDARLQRDASSALRGEATGKLEADTRDHVLRLTGRARYGRTAVGSAPATQTDDQAYAEALYRLRLPRRLLSERWFAPIPYLATTFDTVFVTPEGAPFHHMDVGGTAGLRFTPFRPLEIKAGAGVRKEVLDPAGRARPGVELGWDLPRFSPVRVRDLPVDVESGLDYFVSDLAGDRRQEARVRARLTVPLLGPLALTAGVDFVALHGAGDWAWLSDATLGLTARLDGAHQQF